jgi:hypothetical protein
MSINTLLTSKTFKYKFFLGLAAVNLLGSEELDAACCTARQTSEPKISTTERVTARPTKRAFAVNLSQLRIANSPLYINHCDVCIFLAGMVFESVTSVSITRGFSISGTRLKPPLVIKVTHFAWSNGCGGKSLYPLLPKHDCLNSLEVLADDRDDLLFQYLKSSGKSLVSLHISFMKAGSFLSNISAFCHLLKYLEINFSNVDNANLVAICVNNPLLVKVSLTGLIHITNDGLISAVSQLKNLTNLHLSLAKVTCTAIVSFCLEMFY